MMQEVCPGWEEELLGGPGVGVSRTLRAWGSGRGWVPGLGDDMCQGGNVTSWAQQLTAHRTGLLGDS